MAVSGSSRGTNYMRGFLWGISGEEVIMKNLNVQIEQIKLRTEKGLVLALSFAFDQTEKVPPLTPVDTGNLRASRFITSASTISRGNIRGSGERKFKGKNAATMLSNHSLVLNEAKMIVTSMNNANKKFVMGGYTANYGGFVHEMIGARFYRPEDPKHKGRPGAGPQWLAASIKRNTGKMVQIVKEHAQINK